ncbi:hypothetical protein ABE527_01900 [Brucella sp. TWI432]
MNAVIKRASFIGLATLLVSSAYPAFAQSFALEGRSGNYSEFFLQAVEPSGIEDNRMATVVGSDNRGRHETTEFVVNCNDTMPQVLSPDDVTRKIDIRSEPSNADRMIWQLWFAACRKEFGKLSARPDIPTRLSDLNMETKLEANSKSYAVKLSSLDYSKTLANLVKVELRIGNNKALETAYAYCDEDSATVYWKQKKSLIGIEETLSKELNERSDKSLVTLSNAVWKAACEEPDQNTSKVSAIAPNDSSEQPYNPENKNGAKPKPTNAEAQRKTISEIYQHYLLVKGFCEYHEFPEQQMEPLKAKLKLMDIVAASQTLDTNAIWLEATKTAEQDGNFKLLQVYKMMPVGYEDRIRFSNACEQTSAALKFMIDGYVSEHGGIKSQIEKDF